MYLGMFGEYKKSTLTIYLGSILKNFEIISVFDRLKHTDKKSLFLETTLSDILVSAVPYCLILFKIFYYSNTVSL